MPARSRPVHPRPPRQGPRPLALHLTNAIAAWLSSRAALPLSRSGYLPWRREIAADGYALNRALATAKNDAIAAALDRELIRRAGQFLDGIERYRHHPYRRTLRDPPILWEEGTTRLFDYGPPDGAPVLVVPSLINRAYILDLAPGQSLVRYLSGQGLRVFLLDWGAPSAIERRFNLDDYILRRLVPAAEAASVAAGAAPATLGYCMGGLLALALAAIRPSRVSALALLATPWRFHAERGAAQARLLGLLAERLIPTCEALGVVPVDVLQSLFTAQDPLLAARKFARFAELPQDSAAARRFVALEDWLNDGVPLALPVARDCLSGWYGEDRTGQGRWRVADQVIRPQAIDCPALVVVPAQDRIVPPASAAALAAALPHAERLMPRLGHIGMVVAREAPRSVWEPLTAWLQTHTA